MLQIKQQSMIQPALQNRRWPAAVFRRPHHQDDVGRLRFVNRRLPFNPIGDIEHVA